MTKIAAKIDWAGAAAAIVISLAALMAYHNSFSGPFVFDSKSSITDNPTIRHLWPPGPALSPPSGGRVVSGRPLVNLSLAVNYALDGTAPRGYHALNLLIHILAGLTLFGIVRRTLTAAPVQGTPGPAEGSDPRSSLIGLAAATIWIVHPLQTEAVTYVVQRAESLVGLFYLLTLYCFIRGAGASGRSAARTWLMLAVGACLLGMATKEVMATAPLIILLYDRTFVAGGFREALRRRAGFYFGLGCTWLLLAYLVAGNGGRGGTAGFGTGVAWWSYALTQFKAIVLYLRLSVWPDPLVFDYGLKLGGPPLVIIGAGLVVGTLVTLAAIGVARRSPLGFLGAWFFLILAPTSSVVPVATEILAEHRMYLPLAAVAALAAAGIYDLLGKKGLLVLAGLAAGLAILTVRRNNDYRSEAALWEDTAEKVPDNPGAHNNFGTALLEEGDAPAAVRQFKTALQLKPAVPGTLNNLGLAYFREGETAEAILQYREALRIAPGYAEAHYDLGRALSQAGRPVEAVAEFQEAFRLRSDYAEAFAGMGFAFEKAGRLPDAVAAYDNALRVRPDYPDVLFNLGTILARQGRLPEAIDLLRTALRSRPDFADARANLGSALLQSGRIPEAISQFKEAMRLRPALFDVQMGLGNALFEEGKTQEAGACYQTALRLRPGDAAAHHNLGLALRSLGRLEEAEVQLNTAGR